MRNKQFFLLIKNTKDYNKLSKTLFEEYYITNLYNRQLEIEEVKTFVNLLIHTNNPINLIREFNNSFKIGVDGYQKRLRKDAEVKRLYLYDMERFLPILIDSAPTQLGDLKDHMAEIAIQIYPNNSKESAISQMNKAIRDAYERVNSRWKEYVGK